MERAKTKVITTTNELCREFVNLCKRYKHISFMTAWAGDTNAVKELFKVREKIVKAVVGVSFRHTSVDFIKKFSESNVRYYVDKPNDNGIFHPKAYLFYNGKNDWKAIIGSSNLTEGGFCNDIECNVLLENTSDEDFNSIQNAIDDYYNDSEPYSEGFFNYYCDEYEKQKQTGIKDKPMPHNYSLERITWKQYLSRMIQNEGELTDAKIQTRLSLLKKAHEWLKNPLSSLTIDQQNAVAGLIENYDNVSDWKFFGSTRVNGKFHKKYLNDASYRKGISKALEAIPYTGKISTKDFDAYIEKFRKATGIENGQTIFSRFLAMKRPDVFVCLSSKNDGILELVGAKRKTITPDNYWEEIVENIRISKWYKETLPAGANDNEKSTFKYRAAMLDALCYKPKNK